MDIKLRICLSVFHLKFASVSDIHTLPAQWKMLVNATAQPVENKGLIDMPASNIKCHDCSID